MRLYNSLTRKKEDFKSVTPGKVTIYVCGPTVYNYIHVGNARPLVVFDTLRRYFQFKGYEVDYIVNFTDIDDKMIKKANEEGKTVKEIADRYIEEYFRDADGLLLAEDATIHPRATDQIPQIIEFIKTLEEKGYAYNVNGNVYFNISKFKGYGKLSGKNIDDLISGARVEISDEKNNPLDFALWKKEKFGEPSWDSPWGKGRPGWHIECSVMAKNYLGDTIDIHAGGEDLQFPHHENEIAQSEACTGKTFANYWLHNSMINVENKKMSKSQFNFFTVREISEEFNLEALRFFILSAHYRNPINFSRELLVQSQKGLERLYNGKQNLEYLMNICEDNELKEEDNMHMEKINELKEKFVISMEDDINTADAIASLFEIVKYANTYFSNQSPKGLVKETYEVFIELSHVLGILKEEEEKLDKKVEELIEKRTEARKNKDFKLADQIRDELKDMGIVLEDTSTGVKWKKIK